MPSSASYTRNKVTGAQVALRDDQMLLQRQSPSNSSQFAKVQLQSERGREEGSGGAGLGKSAGGLKNGVWLVLVSYKRHSLLLPSKKERKEIRGKVEA